MKIVDSKEIFGHALSVSAKLQSSYEMGLPNLKQKKGGYQTRVANVMKVPDDVIQRLCGPPRAPGLHGFRGALEGAMLQAVNSGFVAKGLNF